MFTTQHANTAPVIYGVPGSNGGRGARASTAPGTYVGAQRGRVPGYIMPPVSREVGAEFPDSRTTARGKDDSDDAMRATNAFAANTAVSLVINRYDPMSHGDHYRVGTRDHRISLADISTARGRNNIYPPGRWKAAGLSNPLHFPFRIALHSLLGRAEAAWHYVYLYLHLSSTNDPSRCPMWRRARSLLLPGNTRTCLRYSPTRVRACMRAYACWYLQGTPGESTLSIRGKGKRVATTPRQHLNSR